MNTAFQNSTAEMEYNIHNDVLAQVFNNQRIIETAFTKLKPKQSNQAFDMLQCIFADNPSRFKIFSGIHQNSPTDQLHMSVSVQMPWRNYNIHIYGYIRNSFLITHITMMDLDKSVQTIAEFM